MSSKKKKILLLGYGLAGQYIFHSLREAGYDTSVLALDVEDDPASGKIQADFNDLDAVRSAVENVDTVIHLIHTTVPSTSMEDPMHDVQSNLISTIRLLEVLKGSDTGLVYVSSGGAVYGEYRSGRLIEEDYCGNPISSYGIVKLSIEKYIHLYHYHFGLKYQILRPSNFYGPDQRTDRPQGVMGFILKSLREDDTFNVWGEGNSVKDYLHILDFVSAVRAVIDNGFENIGVYNVAYGRSLSLNEILEIFEEESGKLIKRKYLPAKKFDVKQVHLNSSKFRHTFSWSPLISPRAGIVGMLKAHKLDKKNGQED